MEFRQQPDGSYALVAATADQIANGDRRKLSISVAHQVEQCPAAQLAKNNIPRQSDTFAANELGSGAHDTLEHVYLLPRGKRDEDAFDRYALDVSDRVWSEKKLLDLYPPSVEANRELKAKWLEIVSTWAKRIALMEDPNEIDVVGTEIELDWVMTSNGVLSTGKIDRLRRLDSGFLVIEDYKFGVWKGEPNPKFQDGYKEQQHLYLDLYFQMTGERAVGMEILYPRHPHRRIIDFKQAEFDQTLVNFKHARTESSDGYAATGVFPAKPGPLCAWCDIARACPAATIKPVSEFDPPAGRPLSSMPQWKQEKRQKAIKANDNVRTKLPSAHFRIRVINAQGRDCGINDDSRFQVEERTTYIAANFPQDAPPSPVEAAPAESEPAPVMPVEAVAELHAPRRIYVVKGQPLRKCHQADWNDHDRSCRARQMVVQPQMMAARAEAAPQHETVNGQLNLNSYAARPIRDTVEFTFWLLREKGQNLGSLELNALSNLMGKITANVLYMTTGLQSFQTGAAGHVHYVVKSVIRTFEPAVRRQRPRTELHGLPCRERVALMLRQIDATYAKRQLPARRKQTSFPPCSRSHPAAIPGVTRTTEREKREEDEVHRRSTRRDPAHCDDYRRPRRFRVPHRRGGGACGVSDV